MCGHMEKGNGEWPPYPHIASYLSQSSFKEKFLPKKCLLLSLKMRVQESQRAQ